MLETGYAMLDMECRIDPLIEYQGSRIKDQGSSIQETTGLFAGSG
jgi:hypothetical protein